MKKLIHNSEFRIQNSKKRGGFTLVELLIYMGILSILMYVLSDILFSIINVQLSTQSNSLVTQDGRYIYTRLTYDINRAQSVSQPANLGDSATSIQLVVNATNYSYSLNSGALQISDGSGTYVLNSPDTTISNLRFDRIGNVNGKHTFQINFTITSKAQVNSRYDSQVFQTTAGLR